VLDNMWHMSAGFWVDFDCLAALSNTWLLSFVSSGGRSFTGGCICLGMRVHTSMFAAGIDISMMVVLSTNLMQIDLACTIGSACSEGARITALKCSSS